MGNHRSNAVAGFCLHRPNADCRTSHAALAVVAGSAHGLRELFTLAVIATAIGIAYGASACSTYRLRLVHFSPVR